MSARQQEPRSRQNCARQQLTLGITGQEAVLPGSPAGKGLEKTLGTGQSPRVTSANHAPEPLLTDLIPRGLVGRAFHVRGHGCYGPWNLPSAFWCLRARREGGRLLKPNSTRYLHWLVPVPQFLILCRAAHETPSQPSSVSFWTLSPKVRLQVKAIRVYWADALMRNVPLTLRLGILKISPNW